LAKASASSGLAKQNTAKSVGVIIAAHDIFHHDNPESIISLRLLETAAPSFAIKLIPAPVRDRAEIERAIETLAHEPDTDLLLPPDIFTLVHRELIVAHAARHRVRAVYPGRVFAAAGGLVSYGVDTIDIFRRPAGYIDRILRGEKPAELPVQTPTKFEHGDQPQDRQNARPYHSTEPGRGRRRGDRMSGSSLQRSVERRRLGPSAETGDPRSNRRIKNFIYYGSP
jgi:hypothetical protein